MTPPSVLFVSTSTTVGGAERTLHALASGLDRSAAVPAGVVSLKSPGPIAARLSEAGLPVWSLGAGRVPTPAALSRLRKLLRERKPDVVHAFMYTAIQLCRTLKAMGGRFRLISSPRTIYRTHPDAWVLVDRALRRHDDLLVAESETSRRYFVDELGYAPAKVRVIRNGLDPEAWLPDEGLRRAKRAELGLGEGELLVGSVGRLHPLKAQDVLLKALALLPEGLPVRAVLVGDGPERRRLEGAALELGLGTRVRFAGEQEAVRPWLAAMDLFAHPSLWEGLPNAVAEAMAAGLPVVASKVDGLRELVDDGRNGLLVPPGDPGALAHALLHLARDPERRRRLGAAAQDTARRVFDLRAMLAGYQAAYRELAG